MGTSSVGFTGNSLFSASLQNVITKAVASASAPIQQLTNENSTLNNQLTELNQVQSLFTTLQNSVNSLSSATANSAATATVSDSAVITATASSSALPGTYTIGITNAGSVASSLSTNPPGGGGVPTLVTNPTSQNISSGTSFTLAVNGTNYILNLSGPNLNALAQSINSSGAPVQATVINVGGPSSPDYRLAIQATNIGSNAIQLTDGSNNALLTSLAGGSNATYTVNGQPSGGISTNSQNVTIAPGLTVNLEKSGTATVTVAGSTGQISNALSSFVNAYNAAVDELNKNRGQNGGALAGDSIVQTANQALDAIGNYSTGANSGFSSLTSLGITFDQSGHLQFSPTQVSNLTQTQIGQLNSFLGSTTSGGFLQTAANTLTGLLDPTTGVF